MLTAVESDKLTQQERQQKEPDQTQVEPEREEGPKQSLSARGGAIDQPGKRTTPRRSWMKKLLQREIYPKNL